MQSCGSFITLSVTKLCFQGYFIYFDVTLQSMMLIYKVRCYLRRQCYGVFLRISGLYYCWTVGVQILKIIISNVGVQMLGILFLAKGVFE